MGQVCMSGGWDVRMRWEKKKLCDSAFAIKHYINSFNEIQYVYTCKDRVANQFSSYNNSHMSVNYSDICLCTAILLEGWISEYQMNYWSITIVMYTCTLFATRNKWTSCYVEYNGWEELTKLTLKPEAKIKCEYWTCSCKQKPFGSDVL